MPIEPLRNLPTNEFATFLPFTDSREARQYVPINYSDFSGLSDVRHNSLRLQSEWKFHKLLVLIILCFDFNYIWFLTR